MYLLGYSAFLLAIIPGTFQKFLPFMINDLIENYGLPSMLSEFSCNKKQSLSLLRTLSRNRHQTNIIPIDTPQLPNNLIPPNHMVFLVDLSCNQSASLIKQADKEYLFSSPIKWIMYYKKTFQSSQDIEQNFFKTVNILVDSDVTLAELQENATVTIRKIYKIHRNSSIVQSEYIGIWTKTQGLALNDNMDKITAKRRRNLMRTTLKTCLVITHNDSLNHLTDKRDKHIDSIAKVNYVLLEHLRDITNITFNFSIQDTWGYKNNQSQWSGMIGELTRQEADIGGTPLFLTADRVDIIDYIAMTTATRSKFVFREPKLSYVTNVFTLPFNKSVWISTIALGVIIIITLYTVVKWEWHRKQYREKNESDKSELRDSLSDVTFLTFGAFCQQGASSIPMCLPGRITTICLFISFMSLYTSYSANIVALLQSSSNGIKTLQDLLKSRLQVGVDDTVFNHFYFTNATEPVRRAIYIQKVAPPGRNPSFMPIEEGVRRMREGLFAFHMETGAGYKIVSETFLENEKCGLQEIQYIQAPDPWLAIQKNSSYKEMLKIGLRLLQESGLQLREFNLIYSKKPLCISMGSSFISVGLVDCYPAAVVLAGGIIAATVIFIIETYIHYRIQVYKGKQLSLFKLIGLRSQENENEKPLPFTE